MQPNVRRPNEFRVGTFFASSSIRPASLLTQKTSRLEPSGSALTDISYFRTNTWAASPGAMANAGPLQRRNAFLSLLLNQCVLAEWQRGSELDEVAFRVAATIPLKGAQFDSEAFVARLRAERLPGLT
jgi:hypothetical protein